MSIPYKDFKNDTIIEMARVATRCERHLGEGGYLCERSVGVVKKGQNEGSCGDRTILYLDYNGR